MEAEDVKLQDIQAGNEAARKKLEGFRSGLQRLMNKRPKKLSQHQPPHDTKSPMNKKQENYFSRNSANSASSNFNSVPPAPGGQFGFNSTLFRQIGDDTMMLSNPSTFPKQQTSQKFAYNSVPHTQQYFSSSSKPSTHYYQPHIQPLPPTQTFSKASKLFSQVQDIINKSKKTAKMPVKPIQKYFDRIEQNESRVEELEWDLPKQGMKLDQRLEPRIEKNITSVVKGKQQQMRSEYKNKSVSVKDELNSASQFLKNYIIKGGRQEMMIKAPPLPPSFPKEQISKNLYQKQQAKQSSKKHINRQNVEQYESFSKPPMKSPSKPPFTQNSVQIHKHKLKQALNQRKKIMKQDGMLDDSIELELSDQQNQLEDSSEQKIVRQQDKAKNEQQIHKLQAEKEQLLKELELIEEELERLENGGA